MCWHKNCQENELLQVPRLPIIDVTRALTNLPGESGLPANRWAPAMQLPGKNYLSGEVIPGSRSRGGSICREKHCPSSLCAL